MTPSGIHPFFNRVYNALVVKMIMFMDGETNLVKEISRKQGFAFG